MSKLYKKFIDSIPFIMLGLTIAFILFYLYQMTKI